MLWFALEGTPVCQHRGGNVERCLVRVQILFGELCVEPDFGLRKVVFQFNLLFFSSCYVWSRSLRSSLTMLV